MIIMETLFVFLNVQLLILLRIGNLQILPEIGLFQKKRRKENQNSIKSGLPQLTTIIIIIIIIIII